MKREGKENGQDARFRRHAEGPAKSRPPAETMTEGIHAVDKRYVRKRGDSTRGHALVTPLAVAASETG
ncbi:Uncharacterised protein [Yersinia pseudotuberculosis]|nr:Uncharacterised protein [Yersinia pseudotuberculosis]